MGRPSSTGASDQALRLSHPTRHCPATDRAGFDHRHSRPDGLSMARLRLCISSRITVRSAHDSHRDYRRVNAGLTTLRAHSVPGPAPLVAGFPVSARPEGSLPTERVLRSIDRRI